MSTNAPLYPKHPEDEAQNIFWEHEGHLARVTTALRTPRNPGAPSNPVAKTPGNSILSGEGGQVRSRNQPQNPFIPSPAWAESLTCKFSRNLAGCLSRMVPASAAPPCPGLRGAAHMVLFIHGCESFLTSNPWGFFRSRRTQNPSGFLL